MWILVSVCSFNPIGIKAFSFLLRSPGIRFWRLTVAPPEFSTVLKHLYHQISSIWIEKKQAFCPRCFLKAIKYAKNIYKSYKLKHAKISTLVRTPQKDLLLKWFPKVIWCQRTAEWSRAAWIVWVRANSAWSCQLTLTQTTERPESPEMPNEVSSATKKGCSEG